MSLTDSSDLSFRSEDKALHMLFPNAEDYTHNSFDDFLDKELYEFNNEHDDRESPPIEGLFDGYCDQITAPIQKPNIRYETPPQPWRKGLWCLNPKSTSELVVGKTRKLKAHEPQNFVSPSYLTGNDNFATRSPTSPAKTRTKTAIPNPKTATMDNARYPPRTSARNQINMPTSMHGHLKPSGKMIRDQVSQEDFRSFHLQMPDNGMYLSSQYGEKPAHGQTALRHANERIVARNATISHLSQSPTKYHDRFNHKVRQQEEYIEDTDFQSLAPGLASFNVEQLNHAAYINEDGNEYGPPIWTTESLHSSDSSQQSHTSQYSNGSYQHANSDNAITNWVLPPQATKPNVIIGNNQSNIAAPVPQRTRHRVLHKQEEPYSDGLGIHYADTDEIGRAVPYEPIPTYTTDYRATTPSYAAVSIDPYPPLPPYPLEEHIEASIFTTPRKRATSYSTSPSPTAQPTRRSTSRSRTQRSPTRSEHLQSRRKSIHKPGPIKDTSTSHYSPQRRTQSTSRAPRTPKTPTSAGFAQLDFVNFTLKDSAKLMSDVAPSGSSKTRARREQEAKDKRKKLGEAALQAVRNAGGDVRALEDAIFI